MGKVVWITYQEAGVHLTSCIMAGYPACYWYKLPLAQLLDERLYAQHYACLLFCAGVKHGNHLRKVLAVGAAQLLPPNGTNRLRVVRALSGGPFHLTLYPDEEAGHYAHVQWVEAGIIQYGLLAWVLFTHVFVFL